MNQYYLFFLPAFLHLVVKTILAIEKRAKKIRGGRVVVKIRERVLLIT
jgi:hypothetical protein